MDMNPKLVAWAVFAVYGVVTVVLALRGLRKTTDLAGFALGNGDLGPYVTGITLAAAIASTATFVINPGFVYAHGISAFLHLGVASFAGVIFGLVVLSARFRKLGLEQRALTLPHWIEARYGHRPMRTYFAVLNLLLAITFVVLIVKGSALVMQHTLGLGYIASLALIVVFVFSYILMGGTYAHVYTNALQGVLMIGVAIAIVASGASLLADGVGPFMDRIGAQDASLVLATNPTSGLFDSVWSVFVAGFVVGIGLVAQPHILTKSMYLGDARKVRPYLVVGSVVCVMYGLVLVAGLYARLTLGAGVAQDAVMANYLNTAFTPLVGVLISVALLAAGMSTLDGILVSASSIAANDILLAGLGDRILENQDEPAREAYAFRASRWILVGMGVVSFIVALDPPKLVGIFAQVGIYGLVAASFAPVVLGVLVPSLRADDVKVAAVVGPLVHFSHYAVATLFMGQTLNPAVSATSGILASLVVVVLSRLLTMQRSGARPNKTLQEQAS